MIGHKVESKISVPKVPITEMVEWDYGTVVVSPEYPDMVGTVVVKNPDLGYCNPITAIPYEEKKLVGAVVEIFKPGDSFTVTLL
jgi:hypothetical protein